MTTIPGEGKAPGPRGRSPQSARGRRDGPEREHGVFEGGPGSVYPWPREESPRDYRRGGIAPEAELYRGYERGYEQDYYHRGGYVGGGGAGGPVEFSSGGAQYMSGADYVAEPDYRGAGGYERAAGGVYGSAASHARMY
jgi:hypothetical protein